MDSFFAKKVKKSAYLKTGFVLFLFVLTAVFYGLFVLSIQNNENKQTKNDAEVTVFDTANIANTTSEALPVKLSIPKINLNTDFETPLGLNEDREVETPKSFDKVGWYKYSPVPGVIGPAVVLGHVDSKNGPAVFFSLGQLEVGDDIFINRDDGLVAHFKVDFLERYEQKEFPTQKVYGNIDYAGLRLVTCSGIYLRGQQRYTHNLVVYAKLVE